MVASSILRIIEGVQNNDVDKVLRYALQIIPIEEHDIAEECIREKFNPNASRAVMEDMYSEVELLKDELDALNMRYLSQVSLWKSRYEELKKKVEENEVH